ncbi:phage holin, LLH family [Clostridium magnum]|uniref:Uncharacterized protein n=1 Tax=Clostridium magnum DSM 2767 TaxID=1121326 RepID=A0A168E260_9CLOT|nr:phage holin, LLH family [Clostridium magnum]KZL93575.1 hypothetical protein CLMAG_06210 [Clostridium magnum DSM 2767]SHI59681.1 Bacteriophage holin of superfamily 6 (Holin_LLH) [Clostridium magnum DSM 2767]
MISVQTIQLVTTGVVTGGVLSFLGFTFYAKKKGIKLGSILNKAEEVVNTAGATLDTIEPVLPPAIASNLEYIEKWAKIAVGKAQQLYHSGEIGKDDRKTKAEEVVNDLLKELNITTTDSIKTLIDAAIEYAVNESGHVEKTEAEKEIEKQALQAQVAQLTTENTTLKNAITTAASTVQTTTSAAQ